MLAVLFVLLVFTAFGFVMFVVLFYMFGWFGDVYYYTWLICGWICSMRVFGCLLICLFVCGSGLVGGV